MKHLLLIAALISLAELEAQPLEAIHQAQAKFHELLNEERAKRRIPQLEWDEKLVKSAENHNRWMVGVGRLSHTERRGEGFTGRDVHDRVMHEQPAARLKTVGENIMLFTDGGESAEEWALEAFEIWMDSPDHRKNMLSRAYTHHAVYFSKDEEGTVWGTNVFSGMR
jgi:uncharacterized protein YkwD